MNDNRMAWTFSIASLLSPLLGLSAILLYQKIRYPDPFRGVQGSDAAALIASALTMQMLLAIGLGGSLGMAINILKTRIYGRSRAMDYIAFGINGLPMAVVLFVLLKGAL